jgi:predicted GIY-YIG superfamily endonuclease
VYILSSLSKTLYTGVTNDLERRVFEHKEGRPGSFRARYNVSRLVYVEEFDGINQAIAREKEISERPASESGIKNSGFPRAAACAGITKAVARVVASSRNGTPVNQGTGALAALFRQK